MFVMSVAIVVHPPVLRIVTLAYMAPIGLFEIGFGLWLAVRGLPSTDTPAQNGELA